MRASNTRPARPEAQEDPGISASANSRSDFKKIRFGDGSRRTQIGIGIKPVSKPGTERLVRAAIQYAIAAKDARA